MREILTLLCQVLSVKAYHYDYLNIEAIDQNHILTSFVFEDTVAVSYSSYGYFPRSIADIALTQDIESFDLSLARGHYDWPIQITESTDQLTGISTKLPSTLPPAGAILKAKMRLNEMTENSWKTFTNSLAAVTCSSLNRMDSSITEIWRRQEASAQLPAEAVCTENLTPFIRLFKGARDLDNSLLGWIRPHMFQHSHYFALRLSFENSYNGFTLRGELINVWPQKTKFPNYITTQSFFDLSKNRIEKLHHPTFIQDQRQMSYDTTTKISWDQNEFPIKSEVVIKRWITPTPRGMLGNKIHLRISVPCSPENENKFFRFNVRDVYPWSIAPFFHTFKEKYHPGEYDNQSFNGGKIRTSPYLFTYNFTLTACQTYENEIEVENKMLGWTEYPADAERGLFIDSF